MVKIFSRFCSSQVLCGRIADSRRRLYRVALAWCGHSMLADDLVQEALTIAIQRHHQLRDHDRLNAWLYSILNNIWHQHLRRQRNEYPYEEEMHQGEQDPEQDAQVLEIVSRVRRAVSRLPEEQRRVVALVDLEGLAYSDVAEIMDIPIGTVMSRLYRARKALQKTLVEKSSRQESQKGHLRVVK